MPSNQSTPTHKKPNSRLTSTESIPPAIRITTTTTTNNNNNNNNNSPPLRTSIPLRRTSSDTVLYVTSKKPTTAPRPLFPALPRRAKPAEYNHQKAATFASHLVTSVNDSAICLLISLGHQLGLFSVLARLSSRPHSVSTIAAAARALHPRYLQEWLAAMACVGILEQTFAYPPDQPKFRLPPEHAVWLTWNSPTSNMALLSQFVPILARLEDAVVACFRNGKGLGGAAYAHFDSVASLDLLQTVGEDVESRLLSHVSGLLDSLRDGANILCAGAAGDAVFVRLARMFPRSWFTVYVSTSQQVKAGHRLLAEQGCVPNVHFRLLQGGLGSVQERMTYDVAVVLDGSVVRDAGAPEKAFEGVREALRKGAPFLYVETVAKGCPVKDREHPAGCLLYALSAMHALPAAIGEGRMDEVVGAVWGHEVAQRKMIEAGFEEVKIVSLDDDRLNCLLVGHSPR